jgi:hypothetical protein
LNFSSPIGLFSLREFFCFESSCFDDRAPTPIRRGLADASGAVHLRADLVEEAANELLVAASDRRPRRRNVPGVNAMRFASDPHFRQLRAYRERNDRNFSTVASKSFFHSSRD